MSWLMMEDLSIDMVRRLRELVESGGLWVVFQLAIGQLLLLLLIAYRMGLGAGRRAAKSELNRRLQALKVAEALLEAWDQIDELLEDFEFFREQWRRSRTARRDKELQAKLRAAVELIQGSVDENGQGHVISFNAPRRRGAK